MTLVLLLCISSLLRPGQAGAQPYYFRRYDTGNGLSNNSVFSIIQDRQGFMWFGTRDGVSRFDGYRFKNYALSPAGQPSSSPDFVHAFAIDSSGDLWLGTQVCLYRYDREKEQFAPFLDSLHIVRSVYVDKGGQLWFVSDTALYRYNFQSRLLTAFPPGRYNHATSLFESQGGLYISTAEGRVERIDPVSGELIFYDLFSHSPAADPKWIEKIVSDEKGGVFVATLVGIKYLDCRSGTYKDILRYNNEKATLFVHTMLQATVDEWWFGTEAGIYVYNVRTERMINLHKDRLNPYSLSDNAIYALYQDREGGIWAGGYFAGLNYYAGKQFPNFEKYFPDGSSGAIGGSIVGQICKDDKGGLWIATEDAGLCRLDSVSGKFEQFIPDGKPGSVSYSNIHSLMVLGDELWIGTHMHGLDIMDLRTRKVKRHIATLPAGGGSPAGLAGGGSPVEEKLKSPYITALLHTRSDEVYAGTLQTTLRYDRRKRQFSLFEPFSCGGPILCLMEDRQGVVWAGSHNNGILYFDPRTGKSGYFRNEPGKNNCLSNNYINTLLEDSHGFLWIGTEGGGLCRLSPDRRRFQTYTTADGLPGNSVLKVLEDNSGFLWVSTPKGLVSLDTNRHVNAVYTEANGLLTSQFNANAGFRDGTGKLYFGSMKGLIGFNPDRKVTTTFSPPLFITGFQVNNLELPIDEQGPLRQSLLSTGKIALPYDQSTFSLDFAAVSYVAPELTEYDYIMEGLEKKWTSLKRNRKVYFTSLRPGVYTFRLKAAGVLIAGSVERQLVIQILPPFWATWWAWTLYALLSVALGWYVLRIYLNRQRIKRQEEIYAARIEFFTHVAHEIKTPLTLIRGPMENLREMSGEIPSIQSDVSTMERNTDRLLNLIGQLLDFEKTEARRFIPDFTRFNFSQLIKEAWLPFESLVRKKQLRFSLELPDEDLYLSADREAADKIVSNLISNAVKYAEAKIKIVLHSPGTGQRFLRMDIINDGPLVPDDMREKIFEPFVRLKGYPAGNGSGIGLALSRSLTLLHKGKLFYQRTEGGLNSFVLLLPFQYTPT